MITKPILFNTEMVRAILDGRKTVTRRVVKPQPIFVKYFEHGPDGNSFRFACENGLGKWEYQVSPGYRPGDILWVRETWMAVKKFGKVPEYYYRADVDQTSGYKPPDALKWHPSIHMPREAARIWLRVTDVRVEKVQEITWQQAAAEGCQGEACDELEPRNDGLLELPTLRGAFRNLWDSTIKPADRDRYGWYANPWVWVIEFEKCEKPEEG